MRTIAVTGHRPNKLCGYSESGRQRLQEFAVQIVSEIVLQAPTEFVTGMAQGWDQAIASACVALRVPWIAAIPFLGQESLWPIESKQNYRALLGWCPRVHLVCEGGYAAHKMQLRNEWMVAQIQGPGAAVAALWDGSAGGTYNCINYAHSQNKVVVNYWSEWLEFTQGGRDGRGTVGDSAKAAGGAPGGAPA